MSLTTEDVRLLALELPDAVDESGPERIAVSVRERGFVWGYLRRLAPKLPRTLDPESVAISCPIERKALLIEAAPDRFFDDDHYRNYPAVLVRLGVVGHEEVAELLAQAYAWQASKPRKRPKTSL